MAAPKLRRYSSGPTAVNTWTAMHPVVPEGRALVVSKVIVANSHTIALEFYLGVGPGGNVAGRVTLGPGEVYTESNIVVLAGEAVHVYGSHINFACSVYGQEVDN